MSPRPDLIDEQAIRYWLGGVSAYVRAKTAHLPDPGLLQLVSLLKGIDPQTGEEILLRIGHRRFDIADVDGIASTAISAAEAGLNVYISARTVRRDLGEREFAKEADTSWVWGFVIDYDGDGSIPFPETFRVQTSPGHAHYWYLPSLSLEQAKLMARRFKLVAQGDSCTGSINQDYRVPGTPTYPTPKKIAIGRETEPTFIVHECGQTYPLTQLDELLPPAPPELDTPPVATCMDDCSGRTPDEVYAQLQDLQHRRVVKNALGNFLDATGGLTPNRKELLPNGRYKPDRSHQFRHACISAFEKGFTRAEVYRFVLAHAMQGCASKYKPHALPSIIEGHWLAHLGYEQKRQAIAAFAAQFSVASSPQPEPSSIPQGLGVSDAPGPHPGSHGVAI